MSKEKIDFSKYSEKTMKILHKTGCLLVSGDKKESNIMTIGWGLIGILWGKPFFMVAVRPSRHTYKFMEKTGDFTVNVPKKGMEEIVSYCGTYSGREHDKAKEKGLTLIPSKKVKSPIIKDCIIHYECKVKFKSKINSKELPKKIKWRYYPKSDDHTLYFGEILSTSAEKGIDFD